MSSQCIQSQNLFPNTQQLFSDLGPSPLPIFNENERSHKFGTNSTQKIGRYVSAPLNRNESFVPPLVNSQQPNENETFSSQLNLGYIPSSPLPLAKRPRFHVPLRPTQSGFSQNLKQTLDNKTVSSEKIKPLPDHSLSKEEINQVEKLIVKSNDFASRKQLVDRDIVLQSPVLHKKMSHLKQGSPLRGVVPETPRRWMGHLYGASTHEDETPTAKTKHVFGPVLKTPSRLQLPPCQTPGGTVHDGTALRSVNEIPSKYQSVFKHIPYFNIVQSKVFDDVMYTDKALVVCAPTGSGKTAIFELAIIHLLIKVEEMNGKKKDKPKIVYMAPVKALCAERHEDWTTKFSPLGLDCQMLTGDSDVEDFWQLQKVDIILTTPEKWDSMTRRWRDNTSLVRKVQLFLIDEVHLLNDETRGATMEAVVSRMKTVQSAMTSSDLRFVAVSATIPNTGDIADWLSSSQHRAVTFDMDESYRPVTLRRVVLGYPCSGSGTEFKFDISLNYKLANVVHTYSESKPTLVFCATRKSVEQAATTLAKDASFVMDASHKQILTRNANAVRNHRLRELLLNGIGYHHAGLDAHDRHLVENLFTQGELLVLLSTSTLAMGVNLPAHLVVIKSTCHYVKGMFLEYSQTEILQMIGRAGRPQFDTTATAVIMTRNDRKNLYQNIVNGSQNIESSLHKHLIEHLNAEIVLTTIGDVTVALDWIRSTFLYIRLLKNPTHYGYPSSLTRDGADKHLRELCMQNLDALTSIDLITLDNDLRLTPSEPGKLMARYCVAFETMKKFSKLSGTESLEELITVLSGCKEFQDVTLRMNERALLNKLNKDKNRVTIRYGMTGRIKTSQMKVSCLVQATLGCMTVQEFALQQDVSKIFRNAIRVSRCLVELLLRKDDFKSLYNAALLSKCIKARLWENSRYVSKQLPNIGPSLSSALANAGMCSFERLESTDPREIELIVNRHPPFGNHLVDAVQALPHYTVHVEQGKRYAADSCDITIQIHLSNAESLKAKHTIGQRHTCLLLIGDANNRVILKLRLTDSILTSADGNSWQRTVTVHRASKGDELSVKYISLEWVGLDIESTYTPYYLGPRRLTATARGSSNDSVGMSSCQSKYFDKKRKPCRHNCGNKRTCAHDCCKVGLEVSPETPIKSEMNPSKSFTPNLEHLQQYRCNPHDKHGRNHSNQVVPSTPAFRRSPGWELLDSFCEQSLMADSGYDEQGATASTQFEKEQSYYEDQINLGSRITHNEGVERLDQKSQSTNQNKAERLWSVTGSTQDDSGISDLSDITARPSKYTFQGSGQTSKLAVPQTNVDYDRHAGSRMGRVVAWKSSIGQRSTVFPSSTYRTDKDTASSVSNLKNSTPRSMGGCHVNVKPNPARSGLMNGGIFAVEKHGGYGAKTGGNTAGKSVESTASSMKNSVHETNVKPSTSSFVSSVRNTGNAPVNLRVNTAFHEDVVVAHKGNTGGADQCRKKLNHVFTRNVYRNTGMSISPSFSGNTACANKPSEPSRPWLQINDGSVSLGENVSDGNTCKGSGEVTRHIWSGSTAKVDNVYPSSSVAETLTDNRNFRRDPPHNLAPESDYENRMAFGDQHVIVDVDKYRSVDDNEVSIICDFDLIDTDDASDDDLLMAACMQAEESQNNEMSEELDYHVTDPPHKHSSSRESVCNDAERSLVQSLQFTAPELHPAGSHYPLRMGPVDWPVESTHPYTSFFGGFPPVQQRHPRDLATAKPKQGDMEDAKKMFDQIFADVF